jgi:flagellin
MDGLLWTPSKEETIMGLQINTNVGAMNAYRNLSGTQNAMSTSLERLSSGLRINRAADDAAGLGISEKLRAQTSGLNQATANAQDGISLIQTAEGALNESHSILQRMRQLAVQSANDTNTDADRTQIQKEVTELSHELNRISTTTQFNGKSLLDNSQSVTGLTLQIGANKGQTLNVKIAGAGTTDLGLSAGLQATTNAKDGALEIGAVAAGFTLAAPVSGTYTIAGAVVKDATGNVVGAYAAHAVTFTGAGAAVVAFTTATSASDPTRIAATANPTSFTISNNDATTGVDVSTQGAASDNVATLDAAISLVSGQRANLGAVQNRLQHTINSLSVAAENTTAAESRIRDTDMAKEMTSFTRSQILQQAGVSMLAQANQAPQSVLKLLG